MIAWVGISMAGRDGQRPHLVADHGTTERLSAGPDPGVPAGGYAIASSTGVVRAINARAIYEMVRDLGEASAAQIGDRSGLSRPTVALALSNLEASGLLRQNGRRTGGVGRAPRVFEPNPAAGHVLVADVGRSWLRLAVANVAGDILLRRDVRSRVHSAGGLVEQIATAARAVTADAGLDWDDLTHKVVGAPGVFDPAAGTFHLVPNLPGWQRRGVGHLLTERLGGDVTIHNDVNLAAVGERAYGAGRDARDFVYLSLGTGVGMALVLGGQLRNGAHGAAGEVGFLPIFPGDAPSTAPASAAARRRRGELENLIGASALIGLAHRRGLHLSAVSEVFGAARAGDPVALDVVEEAAAQLARAVGAVISIVDPGLVVLGGGIGQNGDLLIPRIQQRLAALVPLAVPGIVPSALGADAPILGGLTTALDTARRVLVERAGLAGRAAPA
jgi:predicted NBD/HSP70 family sugar kinase